MRTAHSLPAHNLALKELSFFLVHELTSTLKYQRFACTVVNFYSQIQFQSFVVMEKCPLCSYVNRKDNVKEHIKRVHDQIKEICDYCKAPFYNNSSLRRHLLKCKSAMMHAASSSSETLSAENPNVQMESTSSQNYIVGNTLFTNADIARVEHVITLKNGTKFTIPVFSSGNLDNNSNDKNDIFTLPNVEDILVFSSENVDNNLIDNHDISTVGNTPETPVFLSENSITNHDTLTSNIASSSNEKKSVPAKLIEEPRSYGLRQKKNVQPKLKIEPNIPVTMSTVSEVCVSFKKRNLWQNCKKMANKAKLVENAIVFAKQVGYAPWPSKLVTKNRSSATVMYYGFNNFTGSVKLNEIVQVDNESKEAIGELIIFTLKTKSIREFPCFLKAVREIQGAMGYSSFD